jgi:hypothetical protein
MSARMLQTLWALLAATVLALMPVREARAMDAFEAVKTVCDQVNGLCGPGYVDIVDKCFKNSDELACTLAIINLASGGSVSQGTDKVDALIGCINAGLPIQGQCDADLAAAGVPTDQINDAHSVITTCAKIGHAGNAGAGIDAVIVCADTLLDSSVAQQADIGIPAWVDYLFDIYGDIKEKDYWGLVYHVGATVACAVSQYITGGVDVCGFLKDLAELAGAVYDAAGDVIAFLTDAFDTDPKNMPLANYYAIHWAPKIEGFARDMFQQPQPGIDPWVDAETQRNDCYNYFNTHSLSPSHANAVCDAMLTGSNASNGEFSQKGFSQMVMRRGAQYLLPNLVYAAAMAKYKELNAQGIAVSLGAVLEMYGHSGPLNPGKYVKDFKYYSPDFLKPNTVGALARTMLGTAQGLPEARPPTLAATEALAKQKLAEAESKVDIRGKAIEQAKLEAKAAADKVARDKQFAESIDNDFAKELNELQALCKPKKDPKTICEPGVKALYEDCAEKQSAFATSHPGMFDADRQNNPGVKKDNADAAALRASCIGSIQAYIKSLPDYIAVSANDGYKTDGLVISGQTGNGKPSQVTKPFTPIVIAPPSGMASGLGGNLNGALTGGGGAQANGNASAGLMGSGKLLPPSGVASNTDEAALRLCTPFRGNVRDLVCSDTRAFVACKGAVDARKVQSCRRSNSQEVYPGR